MSLEDSWSVQLRLMASARDPRCDRGASRFPLSLVLSPHSPLPPAAVIPLPSRLDWNRRSKSSQSLLPSAHVTHPWDSQPFMAGGTAGKYKVLVHYREEEGWKKKTCRFSEQPCSFDFGQPFVPMTNGSVSSPFSQNRTPQNI